MKNEFRRIPNLVLTETKKININQYHATCATGRTLGRGYVHGSITLRRKGIPHSMTHINATILRNALLNSKAVVEKLLGLQIIDIHEVVKEEEIYTEPEADHEEEIPAVPTEPAVEETPVDPTEETPGPEVVKEIKETIEEIEDALNTETTPLGDVEVVVKEDEYQEKLDALRLKTNSQLREMLDGFGYKTNAKMNKTELVNIFINNHLV